MVANVKEIANLFAKQNLHEVPREKVEAVGPEDRMESLQDVHGVLEPVKETPELVQRAMDEVMAKLDEAVVLEGLSNGDGPSAVRWEGYARAATEYPEFVKSQLIRFLRADAFDVERAKFRALKHFQMRLDYFGAGALGKELDLKDLNESDMLALQQGAVQLLKKRDRSGRAIIALFTHICWHFPSDVVAKLMFWSGVMASRDKTVQKAGLVFIHYGLGGVHINEERMQRALVRSRVLVATFPCMPLRVVATHCCTNDNDRLMTYSNTTRFLETRYLTRFQTHFGSSIECRYNLMTFGIPLDVLPVRDDSSIDVQPHLAWLAELAREELKTSPPCTNDSFVQVLSSIAMEDNTSGSAHKIEPGDLDVIMGKGRRGINSMGSHLLKRYLEEYQVEYDSALRYEKAMILEKIYAWMRRNGCRFLAPNKEADGTIIWEEVCETRAHDRISHGFRNRRQASKR